MEELDAADEPVAVTIGLDGTRSEIWRLARVGLVESCGYSEAGVLRWQITDTGRAVLHGND